MTRKRCALVMAAVVAVVLLGSDAVSAQGLGNWIRPDGFASPDLKAGQYSLKTGIGLDGWRSRSDDDWSNDSFSGHRGYRATRDVWSLHSSMTYALTDQWVFLGAVTYSPGQKADDNNQMSTTVSAPPIEFADAMTRTRQDLDHGLSTSVTVAFKPRRLLEVYLSGQYSRTMTDGSTTGTSSAVDDYLSESYSLFLGFNVAR